MTELVMRHEHDCKQCKPLGQFCEYDLYFCDRTGKTLIARFGDKGRDHLSGVSFSIPVLRIAEAMAIEKGYL